MQHLKDLSSLVGRYRQKAPFYRACLHPIILSSPWKLLWSGIVLSVERLNISGSHAFYDFPPTSISHSFDFT